MLNNNNILQELYCSDDEKWMTYIGKKKNHALKTLKLASCNGINNSADDQLVENFRFIFAACCASTI